MRQIARWTAALVCLALPVSAADVALVIGNDDYRRLDDVRNGEMVVDAVPFLRDANVTVLSGEDATLRGITDGIQQFAQVAPNAQNILFVLSGRFVHTESETYFLPVDSDGPGLAEVSGKSLPISVVTAMLSDAPGSAILVLATDDAEGTFGGYLKNGIGEIALPQGVTLVRANPRAAARLMEETLSVPGRALRSGVARLRGASAEGYVPRTLSFLSKDAPSTNTPRQDPAEDAYWQIARDLDKVEAYEAYMSRYPGGRYEVEARQAIADIRAEPERAARLAEEALGLNREQRRQIQRNLSILDYNPRGIDGIFGPGTRAAVTAWQGQSGFATNGYLSQGQIDVLSQQAQRRSAELEAEAEARRLQQEREDRAFWRATGAQGDEAGYREYLRKFPDGRYAEIANARLKVIEDEKRASAQAAERAAWEEAENANTAAAYRAYYQRFPNGLFAQEAQQRIEALRTGQQANPRLQKAAAAEQALRLSVGTKRLIEDRLNKLGLKPGRVDGTFDERTRRALRRYQDARGMPVTGYVSEAVIVRLLAEAILR